MGHWFILLYIHDKIYHSFFDVIIMRTQHIIAQMVMLITNDAIVRTIATAGSTCTIFGWSGIHVLQVHFLILDA
jgi:hypothetical protein